MLNVQMTFGNISEDYFNDEAEVYLKLV